MFGTPALAVRPATFVKVSLTELRLWALVPVLLLEPARGTEAEDGEGPPPLDFIVSKVIRQ